MEPLGRFLEYSMESLESILKAPLGQTLGQKPSGPAAPRVFGLGSGLGGPSIFSLGTPLRTLGNLPRGSIHHYTPSAFPQIVPTDWHKMILVFLHSYKDVREALEAEKNIMKIFSLSLIERCQGGIGG